MTIEVFEGNTGDPKPLAAQIEKLKQRFDLDRVVLVGDRGMITDARIRQELQPAGLDWITALRALAIQELAAEDILEVHPQSKIEDPHALALQQGVKPRCIGDGESAYGWVEHLQNPSQE